MALEGLHFSIKGGDMFSAIIVSEQSKAKLLEHGRAFFGTSFS